MTIELFCLWCCTLYQCPAMHPCTQQPSGQFYRIDNHSIKLTFYKLDEQFITACPSNLWKIGCAPFYRLDGSNLWNGPFYEWDITELLLAVSSIQILFLSLSVTPLFVSVHVCTHTKCHRKNLQKICTCHAHIMLHNIHKEFKLYAQILGYEGKLVYAKPMENYHNRMEGKWCASRG